MKSGTFQENFCISGTVPGNRGVLVSLSTGSKYNPCVEIKCVRVSYLTCVNDMFEIDMCERVMCESIKWEIVKCESVMCENAMYETPIMSVTCQIVISDIAMCKSGMCSI